MNIKLSVLLIYPNSKLECLTKSGQPIAHVAREHVLVRKLCHTLKIIPGTLLWQWVPENIFLAKFSPGLRFDERGAEDEESELDFKVTHKYLCECRRHCLGVVKEQLTEGGGSIVKYISLADDETKVLTGTKLLSIVKKVREVLTVAWYQVNIGSPTVSGTDNPENTSTPFPVIYDTRFDEVFVDCSVSGIRTDKWPLLTGRNF
jgi:hypothetical protein